VQTVLDLALANNRDLHAELNRCVAATSGWFSGDRRAAGVDRWRLGFPWMQVERNDFAPHPLRYVLPLLKPFDGEPEPLMSVLLSQPQFNAQLVTPVLAGAITGARHGREVFPPEWRHWAEPMARPWFPILRAVRKRRQQEASLIEVHETLLRRRRNGMSLLEDKLYGCLLAGSIGNAMGSPVEGWSYEEIEAKYPGGIRTILDPARLEAEDDNQQMMLVLEAYLARDGRPVMGRHLARTWAEQWPRDKFWRFADANSYDLCRAGWDPRITGQWNPMAATTTMCFEPVGLYHLADPEYAAVDARAIACMQQRGLELRVVGTLTSTVAEALRPEATVASVCAAALRAAPRDRLVLPERLRTKDGRTHASCRDYFAACLDVAAKYDDVLAARKEMYARCRVAHFWHAANIEIAAWGLALFKIANGDVRHAAIGGTNIGRDADSVAGRAAMLAGALSGAGNVPKEWIRMFKPAVLRRIRSRARAMARLIAHPKLERLRQRQEIGPPCAR
jgi:ADP-ribosylglycohydrolase